MSNYTKNEKIVLFLEGAINSSQLLKSLSRQEGLENYEISELLPADVAVSGSEVVISSDFMEIAIEARAASIDYYADNLHSLYCEVIWPAGGSVSPSLSPPPRSSRWRPSLCSAC